jgi:pimeloyl-ACP methyl ester carboxylesterase
MLTFLSRLGCRIRYEVAGETGEPERETLVLLHGLVSGVEIWQPQWQALASRYRVVAFDFPGHHHSGRLPSYQLSDLTEVLIETMNHLAIGQAHLVALSIGCNVALDAACRYPRRVRSLVLQGPSGGVLPPTHPLGLATWLGHWVYLSFLFCGWKLLGQARLSYLINRFGVQTNGYHPLIDQMERRVDPLAVAQLILQNAFPGHLGRWRQVRCPVLVIRGRNDRFPRAFSRAIVRQVDHPLSALVEIAGGRHVVGWDAPERFNRQVDAFLQTVMALEQTPAEALREVSTWTHGTPPQVVSKRKVGLQPVPEWGLDPPLTARSSPQA